MKLKTSKCDFSYGNIDLLGHSTFNEGKRHLEKNLKAIKKFPTPTRTKNVRELPADGVLLPSIHRFSNMAEPLMDLTRKPKSEDSAGH